MATLYRPVEQKGLDLIEESGWRRFPPRLSWRPIFYPVLTEGYTTRIARDWNTKDEANGAVGYVLRFGVDDAYLEGHEIHETGGRDLASIGSRQRNSTASTITSSGTST